MYLVKYYLLPFFVTTLLNGTCFGLSFNSTPVWALLCVPLTVMNINLGRHLIHHVYQIADPWVLEDV